MTFQINGSDVADIVRVASVVGTIVAMLVGGLVLYLLVRPPKKNPVERRPDDALDAEEVMQVLDRMEQRLEVLERAMIAAEAPRKRQLLNAGEEARENRREK